MGGMRWRRDKSVEENWHGADVGQGVFANRFPRRRGELCGAGPLLSAALLLPTPCAASVLGDAGAGGDAGVVPRGVRAALARARDRLLADAFISRHGDWVLRL